jgi:hypothetical protein
MAAAAGEERQGRRRDFSGASRFVVAAAPGASHNEGYARFIPFGGGDL